MNTQLLSFHPTLDRSRANRALLDAAASVEGVTIVDMSALYPDITAIDADREAERLLAADRIVLQFPLQWYSVPALLKEWLDVLFTRMFFMRFEEGQRIKGLPMLVATTAGNLPDAFSATGLIGFPLDELLVPLKAVTNRCSMQWTEPFLVHGAVSATDAELVEHGARYARRLTEWTDRIPRTADSGLEAADA